MGSMRSEYGRSSHFSWGTHRELQNMLGKCGLHALDKKRLRSH